ALNCVANGRIRRDGPFERLFIQPAAGDAGACLGAAALVHRQLTNTRPPHKPLPHVYLGPQTTDSDIAILIEAMGIPAADYRLREPQLMSEIAQRLAEGQIVGWFHGRMEFGPRALGHRSILADPRRPQMRERLNRQIKQRELFRPFAPSVLADNAAEHFDLTHPSPFMLETCQVISPLALPAVTHVDGSARPQTVDAAVSPRFAALLQAFYEQTGCPILLNTSLNIRGEPIVCTAVEALYCLMRANLDVLVLENFVIERPDLPSNWPQLLASWDIDPRFAFGQRQSAVSETLYTFV
ncbi:MAG: nodulation protein, partial [Anaerolineales bacterium]|nr:nodulation protein [Anaerolineales bacterium]